MVPGDPGIPSTISPSKADNFAPRIGLAYAPRFDGGILKEIFGDSGKSSIRASYGIFYTAFPGLVGGRHVWRSPLWIQLSESRAAAVCHAFHQRRATAGRIPIRFHWLFRRTTSPPRIRTRIKFCERDPHLRRRILLLSQCGSLHRELHVFVRAADHSEDVADHELCGKSGAPHSRRGFDQSQQSGALPEPEPTQ